MEFAGFTLRNNLIVAPMAGVTDRPFRQLCKKMGAGLAVSEMVTSNSLLYGSAKTKRRANHDGEVAPISVQIAGTSPQMMADAARHELIARELQADVFFARPYHSWERGTSENTNGLIRQYLPKKSSMVGVSQWECNAIAKRLNRRPRKILNLSTPEQAHYGLPRLLHF